MPLDIVAPGTPAAEFYQLSMAVMQQRCVEAGILTSAKATALTSRPTDPDFLGCEFAYIGAWDASPARLPEPVLTDQTRTRSRRSAPHT